MDIKGLVTWLHTVSDYSWLHKLPWCVPNLQEMQYSSAVVSCVKWLETILEPFFNHHHHHQVKSSMGDIARLNCKWSWWLMELKIHFMSVIHTVHWVFIVQDKSVHIHQTWPTIYSLNKWCFKSWLLKNICILVPNAIHSFIQRNTKQHKYWLAFWSQHYFNMAKRGLNTKQNGILRIRAGEDMHFIKSTK